MNQSPGPDGAIIAGIVVLYGVIILVSLASFVFWIVELVDVARRQFHDSNTKLLWVLIVALLHGLGALIYYFAGRPQGWLPGETPLYPPQTPYGHPPPAPGPYPPPAGYYTPPPPPENRQD